MPVTATSAGLICMLIAESINLSTSQLEVELNTNLPDRFAVIGSVMFYGAVIAVILHSQRSPWAVPRQNTGRHLNIRYHKIETFTVAEPITIRSVLSAGADVDTMLTPVSDTEVPGAPTEL